ncbi:unnamed protein product [Caenorhabditis sp. 36 PRJEB53466]|nr:unnamed protein product [Caenorhabditis sp. 36 PRJEB53466]
MATNKLSVIEERTETPSGVVSTLSNVTSSEEPISSKMGMAVRACQLGELETVRFLLGGYVSADELDSDGCGLLHWAAINNKVDIIRLLLSYHANIDIIGGNMQSTPLHWACHNAQLAAVVTLVMNGASGSIKNVNGETPLHIAAVSGNLTLLAYLLVKFDHIKDARDNLGRSALMLSSHSSFGLFPTRIFIKCDAFLDFTDDKSGETALHTMMSRQNWRGAVELLCAGADETIKNREGQTAFDLVDKKVEEHVREHVATRLIRENGTIWDKVTSRWFFVQLLSATITAICMGAGLGLYYLTGFWPLVSAMIVSTIGAIFVFRRRRIDELAFLPVTYICWMGMAELAILIFDTDGFIHWSILMLLCSIWVISATFYWVLIITNPGALERSADPFAKLVRNVEERGVESYCFTCWIPRRRGSHHCSQCDTCVDGFDHHCPWINKCVYRQNIRFFLLFCLTNFLFDVLYAPLLAYIAVVSVDLNGFNETLRDHGILVISFFISILHVIGAGAITYTQLSQVSRHVTTIETLRKSQEAGSEKSTSEEFDPWNHRPSVSTRIRNVWNLLAFDEFGDETDRIESSETSSDLTTTTFTRV